MRFIFSLRNIEWNKYYFSYNNSFNSSVECFVGWVIFVESHELSLYARRDKLSLKCAIRFAAKPSNLAHKFHSYLNRLIFMKRNLNLLNHLASELHHF